MVKCPIHGSDLVAKKYLLEAGGIVFGTMNYQGCPATRCPFDLVANATTDYGQSVGNGDLASEIAGANVYQDRCLNILKKNQTLIDRFFEVAERKVSVIGDYGDENWAALTNEIEKCLSKLKANEGIQLDDLKGWLWSNLDYLFRNYHRDQKQRTPTAEFDTLNGIEFETWLANVLRGNGYEVTGTPITGDQGADLIARRDGKTVVIQAKRYQGSVGNAAIQEVVAALRFYRGDEAWVITSGTFTSSAKALAQANDVKLIDGYALKTSMLTVRPADQKNL